MTESSVSFMKSLFMGDIQEHLVFPYPAMDPVEEDMARIISDNLIKWADDNFDAAEADAQARYPEGTLEALAEMGLFGLTIPEEYGGLGLSDLAYARIYGALAGIEGSLPVTVGAHCSIGIKGLLLYGTEDQKRRYLPDLASGKKLAAFAVTEPGAGSDAASIQSRAVKQSDGSWLLNGQKIWVSNGGFAELFTVFAKTEVMVDGNKKDKISAFLVDWGLEGFTRGPEESKLGIRASSTVPLYFDNVILSADSLLGEEGKGFKIAMHVLNSGRLSVGAGIVGGARALLKKAIQHSQERCQFGRPIAAFELIQEKISQITVDLYVAESMTFLTAALVGRANQDYSLESAICKVFASERGWNMVNEAVQLMGGLGYMKEYPYERALRDARINMIFEGTNEILRLFIALSGMRAPGEYLKQLGNALRDPIKGFGFLTDFALTRVREAVTTPRLTAVHPALKPWADYFTQYVERFQRAVESAIMKFGKRVIDRQLMLKRFADIAINLYAMLAVLSRVTSRIQAVGVEAAQPEIDIVRIFCEDAWRSTRRNLRQIRKHQDRSVRRVAAHMSERRAYDFPL
jgi:acyl-CoA dehydrogenase family protein 9